MERFTIVMMTLTATSLLQFRTRAEESRLSSVLTPTVLPSELNRQARSYYGYRYGSPFYDRLEYERGRCGRCYDDDDDDDDRDYQRDDDRRSRPRSKSKSKGRYDDDRRVDDRKDKPGNSTDNDNDGDKSNDRPSSNRNRGRDRNRYDDRDRYRPDYYDRFLSNRHRDRDYDDLYRDRRPGYDRYPDRYDYSGRYDYGYAGYRRPYDDRYDDAFGGYGPADGRGPHGSFRPWDETYRGLAGWDAGGRGYYFASGRPDVPQTSAWGRPDPYATRPQYEGWQSGGYTSGYRDPIEYRGSVGYGQNNGYRQDFTYGQTSGWQSVGERRPYRDESGVNKLYNKETYNQRDTQSKSYGQNGRQPDTYGQPNKYGQANKYGQTINYGRPNTYGQSGGAYGQNAYVQSSTTQETSYLFQREENKEKLTNESTEKPTGKDS